MIDPLDSVKGVTPRFQAEVQTVKTIKITPQQVKEALIEAAGLTGTTGVSINFAMSGGWDHYREQSEPYRFDGVTITVTTRS